MKWNVLFLVIDSLRFDAVHGDEVETPTLDRLEDEGVAFKRCFAQGISTAPSMTSMLTGRYPLDYGGHWYLEENQPTMAEQFRRNGYSTGAIHSNPNVSRLRNFHRGFDTFEENILPYDADGLVAAAPDRVLLYANKLVRILRRTPYKPAEQINARIEEWTSEAANPWFLWTQYMDVHGPYLPGDDFTYRNKFRAERLWRKAAVNAPEEVTEAEHEELRQNYNLEVEYIDHQIGLLLDALEARNELEDTVIVLVGDHGDEFMEHGRYGHGNLPYDELTHVPCLVRFPDQADVTQPAEVNDLVRTVDLLPTMLDLADAEFSEAMRERMEGESLLPVVGDGEPSYDVAVTEKQVRGEDYLRFGFRTDEWKFLYDGKHERAHLYNLIADPGETTDVADKHPERVAEFETLLTERLDQIERTSEGIIIPDIDSNAAVKERLEALGYR
jgi:arylsulfatase A-like enzyme